MYSDEVKLIFDSYSKLLARNNLEISLLKTRIYVQTCRTLCRIFNQEQILYSRGPLLFKFSAWVGDLPKVIILLCNNMYHNMCRVVDNLDSACPLLPHQLHLFISTHRQRNYAFSGKLKNSTSSSKYFGLYF